MRKEPSRGGGMLVAASAAVIGLVAGLAASYGGRAAAQAADTMTGDWFDALTAEHLEIIELFDLIEETGPDKAARRRRLAFRLRMVMEKHAFEKATVVYPVLRLGGAEGEDMARRLIAVQSDLMTLLYQLDHADAGDADWTALAERLRDTAEALIAQEEDDVFPKLRADLDDDAEAALTVLLYKAGARLL
jgi:hypothetical protein